MMGGEENGACAIRSVCLEWDVLGPGRGAMKYAYAGSESDDRTYLWDGISERDQQLSSPVRFLDVKLL
jgi:hypothetical protein